MMLFTTKRRGEGGLAKVLSKEEAKEVFTEFHTNAIGAYCGIVKTLMPSVNDCIGLP